MEIFDVGIVANDGLAKHARARTFEDLLVWQKARFLAKRTYEITRIGAFLHDFGLASQTQRAAVSVMANIAEGFDRRGAGEFAHFLSYAKGSCSELRSNLFVSLDCGYISQGEFAEIHGLADELSRMIQSLMTAVKKSQRQK